MEEYWDVYDKNRVFQNKTIRRGAPFQSGEYHISCEIWIQNSRKEMLMTKRHLNKKAGGLWEFVGGGVLAGETSLLAAMREVKEEIGIEIPKDKLHLLHIFQHENYFMDVFFVQMDFSLQSIILEENETVDAKWATKEELQAMIERQEVVSSVAYRYDFLKNKLLLV